MFPHALFSSPAALPTASGHPAPDMPPSGHLAPASGPGRQTLDRWSLPTPAAAPETAPWRDVGRWRMSLRDAIHGRGTLSGKGPRLGVSDAVAIRTALKAIPAAVLLPGEDGLRRAAIAALKLKPLDRLRRHHDLPPAQSHLVKEALLLGDACMCCGPIDQRRPRSTDEMAALQRLTAWAGTGPQDRQAAGLVAAVRSPVYRDGVPVVQWQEPCSDADLKPLALPPEALLAPLLLAEGARPRLELSTHTLRADATVDAESPFFSWRTLKPQRLPRLADLADLPTRVEGLDLRGLKPDLQWPDIAPLLERLPDLLRIEVNDEQLMQPPPPGWRLDVELGQARFVRIGAVIEDPPHASFNEFRQTLERQLQGLDLNGRSLMAREHLGRLKQLQRHMTAQPMPIQEVLAILQRETGNCLDANLMRLDELELLTRLGGRPSIPDVALLTLRQALTRRAHQTSAHNHPLNGENLEIGVGLAWAVDRRLVTLLNLDERVSRPAYPSLARLPGVVLDGGPVNDRAAADALIAAEVRDGFPTLALLLCWDARLAEPVAAVLDRDADFRSTRTAIESAFQREYEQAVERSDDPLATSEAFQRKEEALQRARLDHLVGALQPALSRLRAGGVLPVDAAFTATGEHTPL